MIIPNSIRAIVLFLLSFFLASCTNIFETDPDVQARQALQDLMRIQETFRAENNRYARNLAELDKYNLKYHTGIVYLEIESADQDSYRAIALPAESTTARVFAYDSAKGGFYEMDDEEVSQYVLGALNHIRKEQNIKELNDWFLLGLFTALFLLGIRFLIRFNEAAYRPAFIAFFISMLPLLWSLEVLNHMDRDIVINQFIVVASICSLAGAVISLLLSIWWSLRSGLDKMAPSIMVLVGTTLIISLFSGVVMVHTFLKYITAA